MTPSRLQRLVLWLYGWLMLALVPLLMRKLRRRGQQEPGYLHCPEQRLGHYPGMAPSRGWVWLHAVSLGETRAAGILLRALRQQQPGIRILLTHGTATGWAEGTALLQAGDLQVWQVWDTPTAVNRFLQQFAPSMGILLETEVWPHWVQACAQHNVPLHLVNARLSERSLRKAQRQASLALPAYGRLRSVLAQTEADADRLRQLGAPVHGVMGNLKYDVLLEPTLGRLGRSWRAAAQRPVVMLASSREGEEAQWLQALHEMGEGADSVQWLVVPRHPQRFDSVAHFIEHAGWAVARRSQWANDTPPTRSPRQVWLGDSLGEMQAYYQLASVAWLGGSFEPLGGQNLIEAAACGCPIVMGPFTDNFAQAAQQAEQSGAAKRVPSLRAAMAPTQQWLQHPEQLQAAQQAGHTWLAQGRGAAQRCAQWLLSSASS